MPWTLNMCHSSHFNAFFTVKINKMWSFCLACFYFSGTTYHRDSKPMPLDLAHLKPYIHATQAISMHFSQSKSTKCEICACFLNSPLHKMKKTSIWTGKKYSKRLENLHREDFGYANHNALCQNFVWQGLFELWRFFWIFDKKVQA